MNSASNPVAARTNRDALIADRGIVNQLFMQSEEIGERRVQFFVGFVTAIGAAFSLLSVEVLKQPSPELLQLLKSTAIVALLAIFSFGILTYSRIVRRNLVSEEYKAIASHRYAQLETDDPFLPLKDDGIDIKKPSGGLAHLVAVIDGIVLFLLILAWIWLYEIDLQHHPVWILVAFLPAVAFSSFLWRRSDSRRNGYAQQLKGRYLQAKHWRQAGSQATVDDR